LNNGGKTHREQQQEIVDRQATWLPKALSIEDLDLDQLPADRSYMVLGMEKYNLQQRYFEQDSAEPPARKKELEKELRTSYRMGHLDEIKRKQFGKVYLETRKHYMELERYTFLKKQRHAQLKK
jgi:hypothetical protein